MKSSSSRAAGEESPERRQCPSPAQALVGPWAPPCQGGASQAAVFLSTSAPSGSGGIPHFPAEQRWSRKRAGNGTAGGGGLVCRERAVLRAAEQVPGAGHPGWQRCPAAAAMLWDGAFLLWQRPATWVGTRNLQPVQLQRLLLRGRNPYPRVSYMIANQGVKAPMQNTHPGKGEHLL